MAAEQMLANWNFWMPILCVAVNPIYWNVVARLEYYTHFWSRVFCGTRCSIWFLAASILALNAVRTAAFHQAVEKGPKSEILDAYPAFKALGLALICVGALFVCTSFWKLGFYGTFLGDYFGILMNERVTGFPFSVLDHPMYMGSVMMYMGQSCLSASANGLLLSLWIYATYKVAILFEEPFTTMIYAKVQKTS